jgi:UDP-N-acetylmuramyl tripeptide synthase
MRKQQPSRSNPLDADQRLQDRVQMDHASSPSSTQHKRQPASRRRRAGLRAGLAVVAGRTAGALSRRFHLGGGTSIVGTVAQRVYPDIVEHLATELEFGSVMVTGTNGKTTTSSFISAILRDGGLRVWRNREGSNLVGGVASSLVIRARSNGHLRRNGKAISILEVDEAAFPQLVRSVPARVVVFTNLFRDQLDRYGETDSVLTHWKKAIQQLPDETTLILNADDPIIANLAADFNGPVLYYGIEDRSLDSSAQSDGAQHHQVIDARSCPTCGSDYLYSTHFYSHMGHYSCPTCLSNRPTTDIAATRVEEESFDRLRIGVTIGDETHSLVIPLPGLYNVYNALAAIAVAHALSIDWQPIVTGIEGSKPVFGRGERIQIDERTLRLFLAKNPAGFNEVLRTLFPETTTRHVLFILNDNIADGQDISWIWDVDFERVAHSFATLVVAGTRAFDLALRLKYAGVEEDRMRVVPPFPLRALKTPPPRRQSRARATRKAIALTRATQEEQQNAPSATDSDVLLPLYGFKKALDYALQMTPAGETLFVVPTYTALLDVHHELEQRGLTPRYWEGSDA